MAPERPNNPFDQIDNPVELNDGLTQIIPVQNPGPLDNTPAGSNVEPAKHVDDRVEDENFLLCVVLCYIGLPPGIWRTIVNHFLEAVSVEYREQHGPVEGQKQFDGFKSDFKTWSTFNKFKAIICFLDGEGVIGRLALKSAAASALRLKCIEFIVKCGVRRATVASASAIIRRVSLYLELAWISGCAAYCGGINFVNQMTTFSAVVSKAVTEFIDLASAAQQVVVSAFIRPLIIARAMLDPSNWDTTPMGKDALMLTLLGNALWPKLQASDGEAFLTNLTKPLSSFGLAPNVFTDVASAMTRAFNARGGFQVTFTAAMIQQLTPISFVQLLKDWRLLRFTKDPQQIAQDELQKQNAG